MVGCEWQTALKFMHGTFYLWTKRRNSHLKLNNLNCNMLRKGTSFFRGQWHLKQRKSPTAPSCCLPTPKLLELWHQFTIRVTQRAKSESMKTYHLSCLHYTPEKKARRKNKNKWRRCYWKPGWGWLVTTDRKIVITELITPRLVWQAFVTTHMEKLPYKDSCNNFRWSGGYTNQTSLEICLQCSWNNLK